MLGNDAQYVFVPEHLVETFESPEYVLYGWVWNTMSIVVGRFPREGAQKRVRDINALNLQLVGDNLSPLPSLTILEFSNFEAGVLKGLIRVVYRTPNLRAQRFYTVEPLQLDLVHKAEDKESKATAAQLDSLIHANPLRLQPPRGDTISMDKILSYVNVSPIVDQFVQGALKASQIIVPAGLNRPLPGAASLPSWGIPELVKRIGSGPLTLLVTICNISIPISYGGSTLAKDISATLQQTDVRLEQVLTSREQFEGTKLENVQNIAHSTAHYINFFNCVWLIINDIIIGLAVGGFIRDNRIVLARLAIQFTRRYSIELLDEILHWLDNWPVGLKLNTELSNFLCNSFTTAIRYWGECMQFTAPFLPAVLYCIGCSGIFGMTMILSLLSDLLGLLTFHTYICYLIATTVFARLLKLLGSLFNLFRGKRRNILRNRTDNWNYDMDQLLLGTILFTLVTFLLPTVTVYYLLFTLTRLTIIGIQASLETVLAFLNHFPLFALMLRVKDPARLPGGIEFHLQPAIGILIAAKLRLMNKPIPFSRIFFQHITVWSRLSAHYSPLRLLRCLVTGTFITPISRYSIRFGLPSTKPDKIKVV